METFPEKLEDIDKDRIVLKYPCKRSDDSLVWAGLLAAKTSVEMWRNLLSDGRSILEIGIFLKREHFEPLLLGQNGVTLKVNFGQMKGNTTALIGSPNCITLPTTYQVCFNFIIHLYCDTNYAKSRHVFNTHTGSLNSMD